MLVEAMVIFMLLVLLSDHRMYLKFLSLFCQEFNQNGLISKSKGRRLFLTNDLIMCVTVVPKTSDDYGHQNERLSLKWAYPVTDVEVIVHANLNFIYFFSLTLFFSKWKLDFSVCVKDYCCRCCKM